MNLVSSSSSLTTSSLSSRDMSSRSGGSGGDPDEKFLANLRERLQEDEEELDEEQEEEVLDTLLEIIGEKREGSASAKAAIECLVLLGEGMKGGKRGGLGQRLAVELDKGQRPRGEVLRAIVGVANLLPHLRSSFVGTFVHGLVNRLLLHLNPANAEAAMAVLKHLIVASPENISSLVRQVDLGRATSRGEPPAGVNMRFVGDHFCTGIKLGKGMFGTVFLGYHVKSARRVAIKVFDWETLTKAGKRPERKAEKQLRREIELMREAHHPNIVQLLDVVLTHPESTEWLRPRSWAELISLIKTHAHSIHLILEYVPGGDMRDYLRKKGRLSEKEARYWLRQLASGMKFMKDKGILHRDLKPDNLLLTAQDENGVLKVADFGLGRFLHAGEVAETGGVGTPLYMAPEILQWQPHTAKADLWSVGVLVYKMLTDDFPFPASNPRQLLDRILTESLCFPADLELSDEMKDLLSGLLQRDESLRISWNEFFMHPCVNLMNEVWGSDAGQQSSLSASYSELLRELEVREREVDHLRMSLSAAEKTYNELLNQLREKDAVIDTLRRNEFSYQEEIERLRETLSKEAESMELLLRDKEAALQQTTAKDRERKKEVHRLKKKLRQREALDGDRMSSLLVQGAKADSPVSSPPTPLSSGGGLSAAGAGASSSSSSSASSPLSLSSPSPSSSSSAKKTEKELHALKENLKKKEKEERRSFDKINKLKKERDEFAAERAALQVECERLAGQLEVSGGSRTSPHVVGTTIAPPSNRSRKTSK